MGQLGLFDAPSPATTRSALWPLIDQLIESREQPCPLCSNLKVRIAQALSGELPCPRCSDRRTIGDLVRFPPARQTCRRCNGAGGQGDNTCGLCHGRKWTHRAAPWGDRYRKLVWKGVPVDLFTATPATWGAIFLIRTGPADFSERWVTAIKRHGLKMDGGQVLRVKTGQPLTVPDERTAFRCAGWRYIDPDQRR